jgi:NO-binding membrane sensor protein with MHYT domain
MVATIGRVLEIGSPSYLVAALAVCAMSMAMFLLVLGRAETLRGRRRTSWVATGALVIGIGLWATHFVAMLGFRPGFPIR